MTLFMWLLQAGRPLEEAMAMTFVSLVLIQFFNAYNCRSDRLSIVRRPFANRWLNMAVAWELALLVASCTCRSSSERSARSASQRPTGC